AEEPATRQQQIVGIAEVGGGHWCNLRGVGAGARRHQRGTKSRPGAGGAFPSMTRRRSGRGDSLFFIRSSASVSISVVVTCVLSNLPSALNVRTTVFIGACGLPVARSMTVMVKRVSPSRPSGVTQT